VTVSLGVGGRARRVDARGTDVVLDGRRMHVDAARLGDAWSLVIGPADVGVGCRYGHSYEVSVAELPSGGMVVHVNGRPIAVSTLATARYGGRTSARPGGAAEAGASGPHRVVAPMPGRIAKVLVKVGDEVTARQGLVVVEAMKMENELRSPGAGTVTDVRVTEGARVEALALLVVVS